MNRGDTVLLILDYQLNGEDLVEGAYQEIEFQINEQTSFFSVKKKLSKGEIYWSTVSYEEDGVIKSFTGYVTHLSQEESFTLMKGVAEVQLRIMVGNEVCSSECQKIDVGKVLSKEVLNE